MNVCGFVVQLLRPESNTGRQRFEPERNKQFFLSSFHIQIPCLFIHGAIYLMFFLGLDWIGWGGWGVLWKWELQFIWVAHGQKTVTVILFIYYSVQLSCQLEVLLQISGCGVYKCFFFFHYGSILVAKQENRGCLLLIFQYSLTGMFLSSVLLATYHSLIPVKWDI